MLKKYSDARETCGEDYGMSRIPFFAFVNENQGSTSVVLKREGLCDHTVLQINLGIDNLESKY